MAKLPSAAGGHRVLRRGVAIGFLSIARCPLTDVVRAFPALIFLLPGAIIFLYPLGIILFVLLN